MNLKEMKHSHAYEQEISLLQEVSLSFTLIYSEGNIIDNKCCVPGPTRAELVWFTPYGMCVPALHFTGADTENSQ